MYEAVIGAAADIEVGGASAATRAATSLYCGSVKMKTKFDYARDWKQCQKP